MTPLPILDLIAGLIFIYFLMAMVNNSCMELFASITKLRATMLETWLRSILGGSANGVMNHVLLNGLSKQDKSTHYMDGKSFAKSISEEIFKTLPPPPAGTALSVLDSVNIDLAITSSALPDNIKSMLKIFIAKTNAQKKVDNALNEVAHLERQIEEWFDSIMERLTGAYKRRAVWFTFVFALISVMALNIDSLELATYLYNNPEARKNLALASYAAAQDSSYIQKVKVIQQRTMQIANRNVSDSVKLLTSSINDVVTEMKMRKAEMDTTVATLTSSIPIGWTDREYRLAKKQDNVWLFILKKVGGLLITIFAICLGAPFWFDVLGKVANLRSSLKPKEQKS